ncbi:calpain 7 [Mortierella alpina]|nr:calpain 7 [Mortierella alpina]
MDSYPCPGTPKTPGCDPDLSPIDSASGNIHTNGSQDPPASLSDLYTEAYPLAVQAVQEDANGDHHTARLLYCEVCEIFIRILKLLPPGEEHDLVHRKSEQYSKRAEAIWESRSTSTAPIKHIKELPAYEKLAQEAQFAFEQAVAEQEKQHEQGALDFYMDSADLFLQAWKNATDGAIKDALEQRVRDAISRAENLKGVSIDTMPLLKTKSGSAPVISGPSNLTPQELQVLKTTMLINNKKYHPWSDLDVKDLLREKGPFTDPDGMLPLSDKQISKFGSWKRVSQIMENPKMICLISSTSIVQDIVTDCSFVASLCVSASYERRWKKQLIRACIYPRNKFGEPCYNPHGKYLVKLTFNGIARRVVVDDYLPVSKSGTLMCTFSTNKNELWPSIIEKAYMKLMGGYDFPGSNSGIDLYALTGWIPEHIFIKESNFDSEKQWKRMIHGQRNGVALVTIATGNMTDAEADRLGLVPTHAYAVLDLKEVQGLRLLQVKNPWSHKRWKGPFSHLDADSWTEGLKAELNFDQFAALKNDDGIFWIDYESVCATFDTIHINWNLETLNHRAVIHAPWPCNYGPKRDNYNLGYNPQFSLFTNAKGSRPCGIWLLLSKHITVTEENRDFITLHVFDVQKQPQNQTAAALLPSTSPLSASGAAALANSNTGLASQQQSRAISHKQGTRIYYEGNSMIKGMYVNSPHILVRFEVPPGQNEYTIVLSQHVKTRDLHFTLRAYAACEFELREIPKKYAVEKKFEGEWSEETAGGSSYNAGFLNNPQYKLVVPVLVAPQTTTSAFFMLESPKDFAAHVQLVNSQGKLYGQKISSRSRVNTGMGFAIAKQMIFDGMFKKILRGEWVLGVSAMGWHHHQSLSYAKNPHFLVPITEMTTFMVRLQTPEISPMPKINVTVFERLDEGVLGREVSSSGPYTSVPQGVATEPTTLLPNQYGYLIVVSILEPGIPGKFVLYAYSDRALDIEPGGGAQTTLNMSSNSSSSGHGGGVSGLTSSIRSLSVTSSSSMPGSPSAYSPVMSPTSSGSGGGYANNRPSARFRRQFGSGSGQGAASVAGSSGPLRPNQ